MIASIGATLYWLANGISGLLALFAILSATAGHIIEPWMFGLPAVAIWLGGRISLFVLARR